MAGTLTRIKSVLKSLKRGRGAAVASFRSSFQTVYVGKSRRRYLIASDITENPLFRELIVEEAESSISVGCEVVLFDHLLWMLENGDPLPESLDELVEFYAC